MSEVCHLPRQSFLVNIWLPAKKKIVLSTRSIADKWRGRIFKNTFSATLSQLVKLFYSDSGQLYWTGSRFFIPAPMSQIRLRVRSRERSEQLFTENSAIDIPGKIRRETDSSKTRTCKLGILPEVSLWSLLTALKSTMRRFLNDPFKWFLCLQFLQLCSGEINCGHFNSNEIHENKDCGR
jgi:hypothetical protein